MEKLSFKLEVFEGPLDLLLYLISKNKLNIYDVSISELLDQYMEYLDGMREMDLDVTSDFLEMASRLVQIKSSMLLPKMQQDAPDPGRELIAALIEYKTCKAMAEALRTRDGGFDAFDREPARLEQDQTYRLRHSAEELRRAYRMAAAKGKRRVPDERVFQKIVAGKFVSVGSRIVYVLKLLAGTGKKPFKALFAQSRARSEAVATFLAVLELIRAKTIAMDDESGELGIVHKEKKRGRVNTRAGG